jgi:hypothetical protein
MEITNYIKTLTTNPIAIWNSSDPGQRVVRVVSIQADANNIGADVYVGGASMTSGTGQHIINREAMVLNHEVDTIRLSTIYVVGTVDDTVRIMTVFGAGGSS